AGYGFNKSHAAAYAMVAYQTAYLKANHPVEFFAASMTLDKGNTEKLSGFRQELDRQGIPLLPPDINRSGVDFTVDHDADGTDAIRYALSAIRNVGEKAMELVVAERAANGPFKDLFDFAGRVDPRSINKRMLEGLTRAGAFDGLNPNRAQVLEGIEVLLRYANRSADERGSNQQMLFAGAADPAPLPPLPVVEEWPMIDKLNAELDALGFYLSAHPLDAYGTSLKKLGVTMFADLMRERPRAGPRPVLAGIVLAKRERRSQRGRYAFVQMSDPSGVFEITVFSEVFAQSRDLLDANVPLLVEVDIRDEEDSIRLMAGRIRSLDEVAAHKLSGYRIFVSESLAIPGLRGVVEREGAGRGRLNLVVPTSEGDEVEIALKGNVALSPAMRAALKSVPGVVDVHDL
ncbi:MAG: DNA polymerase III subunit alpha, partial [Rhodospirillaceae bacterium]|nr:DNA polymerase III subunit alpha [Rhodospirillaceae bacterium]